MKTLLRKHLALVSIVVAGMVCSNSCASYVQDIAPLIDVIADNRLNDESQVTFLSNGVLRQFSLCYAQMTTLVGGLSDEFFFDARVPNATFPTFNDIDNGIIQLDNNSVNNQWLALGNMRFTADNFAERIGRINFSNPATRSAALYTANLYGGIVRFWYGAYFGLEQNRGGGVINGGPFIPSAAMFDSAIAKLRIALDNAANDVQRRTVNTVIAKVQLAAERYADARAAALNGLRRGDPPLNALYDLGTTISNQWFFDGGRNRAQFVPSIRFAQYILADSLEGRFFPARIVSGSLVYTGTDAEFNASLATRRLLLFGPVTNQGLTFYVQGRFPNQDSPMPFVSWQENELILAETALRVANNPDAALANVNNVRTFHNLAPRTVTNLDSIYIERDKQLFATGMRVIDQRRFNRWHITTPGAWRYLPIGQPERNTNKNLRTN
ncbi:MAG: hypothetical protein RML40_07695 [Bacteroidota bacterium]|nr:hypothetical protein [Candidatus Kapabacteria bacterium]MDW8220398.1 hypothetical protein [Bacteroidota bacterium]